MAAPPAADRDVDRAALLGTALAAVVALSFGGQGEWDWLAATTGVALLTVLAAFFRLPGGPGLTSRARVELAAGTAVAALAATLVVAPVLQAVLASTTDDGRTCRASAAVAAAVLRDDEARQRGADLAVAGGDVAGSAQEALARAARDEQRTVLGNCLGAVTSRWLWAPAVGLAGVGYAVAETLARRRPAPGPRAGARHGEEDEVLAQPSGPGSSGAGSSGAGSPGAGRRTSAS